MSRLAELDAEREQRHRFTRRWLVKTILELSILAVACTAAGSAHGPLAGVGAAALIFLAFTRVERRWLRGL